MSFYKRCLTTLAVLSLPLNAPGLFSQNNETSDSGNESSADDLVMPYVILPHVLPRVIEIGGGQQGQQPGAGPGPYGGGGGSNPLILVTDPSLLQEKLDLLKQKREVGLKHRLYLIYWLLQNIDVQMHIAIDLDTLRENYPEDVVNFVLDALSLWTRTGKVTLTFITTNDIQGVIPLFQHENRVQPDYLISTHQDRVTIHCFSGHTCQVLASHLWINGHISSSGDRLTISPHLTNLSRQTGCVVETLSRLGIAVHSNHISGNAVVLNTSLLEGSNQVAIRQHIATELGTLAEVIIDVGNNRITLQLPVNKQLIIHGFFRTIRIAISSPVIVGENLDHSVYELTGEIYQQLRRADFEDDGYTADDEREE